MENWQVTVINDILFIGLAVRQVWNSASLDPLLVKLQRKQVQKHYT